MNPFPCFSGVRVFSRDYANPRVHTTNVAFERAPAENFSVHLDFTHAKGVHLTRFLNVNRNNFFSPFLGVTPGLFNFDGFPPSGRRRPAHHPTRRQVRLLSA